MYRSWAYILMIAATLVGVVALLWPTPPVRTIEEIAMPEHVAPRSEAPPKPVKAAKPAPAPKPAAKPAAEPPPPPAVVKKMPALNTTTKRSGPQIQNGMQPNIFGKPVEDGTQHGAQRPVLPPRPSPNLKPAK